MTNGRIQGGSPLQVRAKAQVRADEPAAAPAREAREPAGATQAPLLPTTARVREDPRSIPDPVSAAARKDLAAMIAKADDYGGRDVAAAWLAKHFPGGAASLSPAQAWRVHVVLDDALNAKGALFRGLTAHAGDELATYARTWNQLERLVALPGFDARPESVARDVATTIANAFGASRPDSMGRLDSRAMTPAGAQGALALLDRALSQLAPEETTRAALLGVRAQVGDYAAIQAFMNELPSAKKPLDALAAFARTHLANVGGSSPERCADAARVANALAAPIRDKQRDAAGDEGRETAAAASALGELLGVLPYPEQSRGLGNLMSAGDDKYSMPERFAAQVLVDVVAPTLSPASQDAIARARGTVG